MKRFASVQRTFRPLKPLKTQGRLLSKPLAIDQRTRRTGSMRKYLLVAAAGAGLALATPLTASAVPVGAAAIGEAAAATDAVTTVQHWRWGSRGRHWRWGSGGHWRWGSRGGHWRWGSRRW